MLSDEDHLLISERSFDNDRDVANFAYRLGIERASRAPDAAIRAVRVFLRESGLVLVSDKPLCYGVLLTDDSIDYSAPWPGACHDHTNDMLMNDETHERYKGARVIPIYTTATPPPPEGIK